MQMDLNARKEELTRLGVFLSGPEEAFEIAGRKTLMAALDAGLMPYHKVLDIGAGCMRVGYWLHSFVGSDNYYAIEPNKDALVAGRTIMTNDSIDNTHLSFNDGFRFTEFGTPFDFFVARSIWSHASKAQIECMLGEFVRTASKDGVLITSYFPVRPWRWDYKGDRWVGRSHESDEAGIVRHSFRWIKKECDRHNLTVEHMPDSLNFQGQKWVVIRRGSQKEN